ncbi:MAG TPA: ABC transporter substrate-binding protein [Stellaceae bacterium]|nr:ABC transporter substrate-binding protein [Stellaceae bacterium]
MVSHCFARGARGFLVLVGVFAIMTGTAAAAAKIRAGTPEPTAFVFSALDVGIEGGFFKKYGLDVERIDFAGGAKLHQAMTAGDLDMIVGTGSDMLFLARGAPEKAVAAYGNDLRSLSLIVLKDSPIKSLADLKGKTIGVTTTASFTSWIARQLSIHEGWGPNGVKVASLGNMSGIVAGMMAKNVDAIIGTTAAGLKLESEGRARIIVTAGDVITDFIADMIYTSDAMMQHHPDQVRGFLRGWFDTIAFMKTHKAETIRMTQKDTHLPDAIAARIYDAEMPTFFSDGHFDRKKLAAVKQSLVDLGLVKKMPPDSKLITEAYLPKP